MLKDLHKRLRPMGIMDILDETVELYKRNFVLLVGIAAFAFIPLLVLQLTTQRPNITESNIDPGKVVAFAAMVLGSVLLYLFMQTIATGALTFAISDRYLERETSVIGCYRRMFSPRVFFSFLGANLLVGAMGIAAIFPGIALVIAGLAFEKSGGIIMIPFAILLIIAGAAAYIYVGLRLAIVTPALLVETGAAIGAIKRSWNLMKGNLLKAAALLIIASVFVSIIEWMVTAPFQIFQIRDAISGTAKHVQTPLAQILLSTIASTIFMPVNSIVVILFYYDMRIRKEGFDLELLARDLDERARGFAAEGAAALPQEQVAPQPPQEQVAPPAPPQEPPPSTEGQA